MAVRPLQQFIVSISRHHCSSHQPQFNALFNLPLVRTTTSIPILLIRRRLSSRSPFSLVKQHHHQKQNPSSSSPPPAQHLSLSSKSHNSSHRLHPSVVLPETMSQKIGKAVRRPGAASKARVYADVNVIRPKEYWDYESLTVQWG